jgi:signal transduction histidine kinase/CheY-like chemotaxis protein/HPt (histidine-containing phosphotransfer) domain-containing protein
VPLKLKIAILVGLTFLGLTSVELGGSMLLLRHSERKAEEENGRLGAERARSAMAQLAAHLRALAFDYGTWDEACAFLDDRNQSFLDSNFPEGKPLPPRVDFVALLDREYRTVFASARDPRTGAALPLPYDINRPFPAAEVLRAAMRTAGAADGLIRLPGGIAVAAAHIAKVEGAPGLPHGFIVFGLRVGRPLVDDLAGMIGGRPSVVPWEEARRLGVNLADHPQLTGPAGVVTVITSEDSLQTFVRLDDTVGNPAIAMRLDAERTVHRQAVLAQKYFLVSMILATCAAGLITLSLLGRIVFTRLFRLESELNQIGRDGIASVRVRVDGRDELARLAERVNDMLASLEHARQLVESARDSALQANRAKSDFLANMSHELRTPMNGVIGLASILSQRGLPTAEQEMVEGVLVSAEHLLGLINDLLDLSKMAAGKLELHPAVFGLRELVEDVGRLHGLEAVERGLQCIIRVRPGSPDLLMGDAKRVRQVLSNLLGNAVKYTERGRVVLEVSAREIAPVSPADATPISTGNPAGRLARLEFLVRDTGVGIPTERQEEIFSRFERGDPSVAQRFSGTGLGLAICSQFVARMGGTISVWSHAGRGTRFRVHLVLPLAEALSESRTGTATDEAIPPIRLLVMARSRLARCALVEAAADAGAGVTAVGSLEEARICLREAAPGEAPFDAVLALHDPPRDGRSALALAAEVEPGSAAVIVAAPSSRLCREAESSRGGGRVFTLAAPVARRRLRETFREILQAPDAVDGSPAASVGDAVPERSGRPADEETPAVSSGAWPGSRSGQAPRDHTPVAWGTTGQPRILVADDNQMNRYVAELLLTNLGCRVEFAVDGAEAVEKVLATNYDLVLMDWIMPRVDGPEAVRRIREHEGDARRTMIVALSALSLHSDEEERLAGEMDGFLGKPIDPAALREVLRTFLGSEIVVPGDIHTPGTRLDPPATESGVPAALPTSAAAVDPELVRLFLMEGPQHADALVGAVEGASGPEIRRAAHALKSMCAILEQAALTETCRKLEFAGRDGDLDHARELLPVFIKSFDALQRALRDGGEERLAA